MFRMTLKEWRQAISQIFTKAAPKARTAPTGREMTQYRLFERSANGDVLLGACEAMTKSEARAIFKRTRNLRRIPVTMKVVAKG